MGRVGWAIAALGLGDAAWLRSSDRYYQALAQPTLRKLALLVGINQYPSTQPLRGCLTDVELQRELLIHRFGFQEADILTLTEQQATREQIEAAFLEHLIKQAQPGDVVVFHFSGYGRRLERKAGGAKGDSGSPVPKELGIGGRGEQGEKSLSQKAPHHSPLIFDSLVPFDGVMLSGVPVVNDLLDETLLLLLRSLSTNNITTILDTSFNTPGIILSTNLRSRSFAQAAQGEISAAELAFQQQLGQNVLSKGRLNRLNAITDKNLVKNAPTALMPGVVLVAAGSTQSATEAKWTGFSAGLFTYALTQSLWEATPATTVQVSLNRVRSVVEQLVDKEQQPQLSVQKNRQATALAYHLRPDPSIGADGVVKLVEEDGKTAQIWLAGLPPTVLEYYEAGSKLTLVASQTGVGETGDQGEKNPPPLLQVRSRTGLTAKAQIVGENSNNSLQGQLVQEAIRVLPSNIRLNIALDASLERIERVDATSAFAAIPYVFLVTAKDQLADYIFGRVPEAKPPEASTILSASPPSRYGLFSLGQKLIPNTAGEIGEAVKVAVQRVAPKLQTLLAAKIWRLTTNEGSSLLNVKATLEIINAPNRVLMQRETMRSLKSDLSRASLFSGGKLSSASSDSIPTIPIGSRIQYRVYNDSDRPVYLLLLGLDSSKNAIALYSTQPDPTANGSNTKQRLKDVALAPGETLIVPQTAVDFEWVIHKPAGLAEHQLIFSSAKFTHTLAAMAVAMQDTTDQQYIGALSNPLEVVQAMMQDLHNASKIVAQQTAVSNTAEAVSPTADTYSLDVNNWASLSFIYQVA